MRNMPAFSGCEMTQVMRLPVRCAHRVRRVRLWNWIGAGRLAGWDAVSLSTQMKNNGFASIIFSLHSLYRIIPGLTLSSSYFHGFDYGCEVKNGATTENFCRKFMLKILHLSAILQWITRLLSAISVIFFDVLCYESYGFCTQIRLKKLYFFSF